MDEAPPKKIRALLVDEHPVTRVGLSTVLAAEDVGAPWEAGSTEEALRLAREHQPDVVVMDLEMKGEGGGTELVREMKALPHPPGVVVHTASNSEDSVFSSRIAGADSYVHKGEAPRRIVEAVKETEAGKRVWFLGEQPGGETDQPVHDAAAEVQLTPREREVFGLLIKRYTNAEISEELSISLQTVKNHVSSVLKKLGAGSRTELP